MSSSRCRTRAQDAARVSSPSRLTRLSKKQAGVGLVSILSATALALPGSALAVTPVNLGTAAPFGVLAGSSVTNTGPSTVFSDLGVDPGTSVTGFGGLPDGTVLGTIHTADAVALQAKSDLSTAYGVAAGETPTAPEVTGTADIGGQTLTAGVYKYDSSLAVTGTLTLDGQGHPDGLFVFEVGSTLTTATNSTISYINGAQPCNVYWQVGSSATLGTSSLFAGNILAAASVTVGKTVTVNGRLLAGTGDVTLIDDTIHRADCATPLTTPPVTPPVTSPVTPPVTPVAPPPGTPPVTPPTGTPVTTPPVATPPVATPPVATPPVATPPVATPPVATPPVATPPVATPPVVTPPVVTPPVATPPVATPPVATPPVVTPPVVTPPVAAPPVATPPAGKPIGSRNTTNREQRQRRLAKQRARRRAKQRAIRLALQRAHRSPARRPRHAAGFTG